MIILFSLNDNFFFRLRDIKNLNVDLWRSLGLPLNLYFILNERIKLFESQVDQGGKMPNPFQKVENQIPYVNINMLQQTEKKPEEKKLIFTPQQPQPQTPSVGLINIPSTKEEIIINQNNIKPSQNQNQPQTLENLIKAKTNSVVDPLSYSHDLLKKDIYKILDNLATEINNKELTKEILKKLHTIIVNIISNPGEEKFRKLNTESKFFQNTIHPYKNTLKFLELLQFAIISDQYIEYQGDHKFLIDVGERLNEYLIDRSNF
jgi:hypothetical protein